MPEKEEVTSKSNAMSVPPCGACKLLRRRCVPSCPFAAYFPPEDDPARFTAVHMVFGASNVGKILEEADLPEQHQRQRAANTLVDEARARMRDPGFGFVSYITVLQTMNEHAREQVAAMRRELARNVGPEAAPFVPFDPQSAKLAGLAQADAALENARKRDDVMRAMRHAADAKWLQQHAARHPWILLGLGAPRARGQKNRHKNQQMAAAQTSAAMAESSREQAMSMRQATAAKQHCHLAAQHAETRHPHQQMAETQKSAAAAESARDREMLIREAEAEEQHRHLAAQHAWTEPGFLDGHGHQQAGAETRERAAAAEVAREQDVMMMMMQQQHNPVGQYAGMPHVPREIRQQMEEAQLAAAAEVAKKLDMIVRQAAAGQQYHDPAAAQYAAMGLDVTLGHEQPHKCQQMAEAQQQAQAAAAEAAREQDMMQLLAEAAPQFDNLAAQYVDTGLDIMLGHGHPDMHQQTVQQMVQEQQLAAAAMVVTEQDDMIMQQAAAAELAREQEMIMQQVAAAQQQQQHPVAQYGQTELDITLEHGHPHRLRQETAQLMVQEQQLAAAAMVAREQEYMIMLQAATAELAREQEVIMQQAAAAELAREQEMMLMQQAAAAQQQQQHLVAQYAETELAISLGQGHQDRHLQIMQQMLQEQQLAGAVEVTRDTMVMQHAAHAEPGSGSGATMAFQLPEPAEATPFLVDRQPPSQAEMTTATACGFQLDSSLPQLLPSLGQSHAQELHQQNTDGGDQGEKYIVMDMAGKLQQVARVLCPYQNHRRCGICRQCSKQRCYFLLRFT